MVSRLLHVPAHDHAPVPEDGDLCMKPRFALSVCALTPGPKLAFTSGWGPSDRPRPGRPSPGDRSLPVGRHSGPLKQYSPWAMIATTNLRPESGKNRARCGGNP